MRVIASGSMLCVALVLTACSADAPQAEPEEAAVTYPELHCSTSASPEDLAARPSPLDSVVMELAGAPAKLCYGRPSAQGRVMVGGLDPFDAPWRMGANEPTTLHLAAGAMVGGVHLDAGSYSVYAIPTEGDWTVVLNGNADRWGVPISEEVRAADIGSFVVTPTELAEPAETLTFTFEPGESGGTLVFSFEGRTFSFPIMGH